MLSIPGKLRQIFVEQLGVEEDEVTDDARISEDLGADSLDKVELIMAVEEAFDIEISDEEAEKLTTVKEAADYISRRRLPSVVKG